MRLDLKIFLTSAVVIIVLAAVGVLSLRALGRVVSASQEITTRAVPSLSRIASAREAITRLLRLEGRAVVLGDSRYVAAWDAHAVELSDQVQRLAVDAQIPEERAHLRDASVAFARYRRLVADEQELGRRGERAQALRLSEGEARTAAERVEASLDGLRAVTHARLLAAQAEAARLEAQTWTASLVALGAAVGLALLGTGVVARQMTRSLRRLSAATAQVAAGAFREPITIRSHDEIGALARDFNLMAGQLRELETTKENFFASITHELRSPLTSIRGATDLLRDGAADPLTEKQARLADLVNQSSERLLRLVNQILEVSRLRAGLLPELLRVPRRRGIPPPDGHQPRDQRDPVHAAGRPGGRAPDRPGRGCRTPGRGHRGRHSSARPAAHLRRLSPGPRSAGRDGPGVGDRARRHAGPRRARDGRVSGRQWKLLHGAPAARLGNVGRRRARLKRLAEASFHS